jgi:hypothetical protein
MISFLKKGKEAEYLLCELFQIFGETKMSSENEDIYEHWDFSFTIRVDVKTMKKLNRNDEDYNENIHWIELRNVHGKRGWVHGNAQVIAFETKLAWILVERPKLIELLDEKIIDKENFVTTPQLYRIYRRSNRKDAVVLVNTSDLKNESFLILDKLKLEDKYKKMKELQNLL